MTRHEYLNNLELQLDCLIKQESLIVIETNLELFRRNRQRIDRIYNHIKNIREELQHVD